MKTRKRKIKYDRIILGIIILILLIFGIGKIYTSIVKKDVQKDILMIDLTSKTETEIKKYATENKLILDLTYEYNDNIQKDKVISQSIKSNTKIKKDDSLKVVISLGKIDKEKLKADKINELGNVPIMMYHGIIDKKSSETDYTGGNVDKDGYNRTVEAFREDLEFYYQEGYRMIRLIDYVNGEINTEYGKSPIVITFDDGNENNIRVTGLDEKGNIIIDENSAVGVLEAFKEKHPDFNVTATFFVNDGLFNQPKYNEKIIKWLTENGYDVGNHTKGHLNISKATTGVVQNAIAHVYKQLDEIVKDKYVKIIALPFGEPVNKKHANFPYVLNGTSDNYTYETTAALRVGWEPEVSPFNKNFDQTYMKRCRAYDNNGVDFDIEMVFRLLESKRYRSDGNAKTIVTTGANSSLVATTEKEIITY